MCGRSRVTPPAFFGYVACSNRRDLLVVQVQSSWFPLYDRDPQTFVTNIFWAKPADDRKATQRLFHSAGQASRVDLPVASGP